MGAHYRGHKFKGLMGVNDGDGDPLPGHFALVYRYHWGNDGVTDVAFLCDPEGAVYRAHVVRSNAVLNQPFILASASIKVLGAVLVETLADDLSEDHRVTLQRFLDAADAQGMLGWALWLQQSLE